MTQFHAGPETFIVDVTTGKLRVFGPLAEEGGCLRTVSVNVVWGSTTTGVTAKTLMNVCTETVIDVLKTNLAGEPTITHR